MGALCRALRTPNNRGEAKDTFVKADKQNDIFNR